jgi:CRISPR-associated protein Cas1
VNTDFDGRRLALEDSVKASGAASEIAALDGVEGSAAREYFGMLMEFNKSEMTWPGRKKHPATDPLNALLSLTYTLLTNEATALLEGAGLDPYLGFLHQVDYGRPSLALDVIEPFRHPVADRLTLTLINKRVLEAGDFQSGGEGHGVFLSPKPMRRYFEEYEKWMLAKSEGGTGFRETLRHEVEKLGKSLGSREAFTPWVFRRETEG